MATSMETDTGIPVGTSGLPTYFLGTKTPDPRVSEKKRKFDATGQCDILTVTKLGRSQMAAEIDSSLAMTVRLLIGNKETGLTLNPLMVASTVLLIKSEQGGSSSGNGSYRMLETMTSNYKRTVYGYRNGVVEQHVISAERGIDPAFSANLTSICVTGSYLAAATAQHQAQYSSKPSALIDFFEGEEAVRLIGFLSASSRTPRASFALGIHLKSKLSQIAAIEDVMRWQTNGRLNIAELSSGAQAQSSFANVTKSKRADSRDSSGRNVASTVCDLVNNIDPSGRLLRFMHGMHATALEGIGGVIQEAISMMQSGNGKVIIDSANIMMVINHLLTTDSKIQKLINKVPGLANDNSFPQSFRDTFKNYITANTTTGGLAEIAKEIKDKAQSVMNTNNPVPEVLYGLNSKIIQLYALHLNRDEIWQFYENTTVVAQYVYVAPLVYGIHPFPDNETDTHILLSTLIGLVTMPVKNERKFRDNFFAVTTQMSEAQGRTIRTNPKPDDDYDSGVLQANDFIPEDGWIIPAKDMKKADAPIRFFEINVYTMRPQKKNRKSEHDKFKGILESKNESEIFTIALPKITKDTPIMIGNTSGWYSQASATFFKEELARMIAEDSAGTSSLTIRFHKRMPVTGLFVGIDFVEGCIYMRGPNPSNKKEELRIELVQFAADKVTLTESGKKFATMKDSLR